METVHADVCRTVEPQVDGRSYLPGLDGLRAVAVVSVVLFHAGIARFQGGWLGVDLFIVLSGWLITGILITEVAVTGTVSYGAFLARRVRRLVPAVALLLGGVGILAMAGQLALPSGSVTAAATWTSNWYQLASQNGYWAQAQGPSPLDHLWSLAVEEQFYVVWPLIVLLVARCWARARPTGRVRAIRTVAVAGAAISALVALWATRAPWQLDRIYMGTDTRSTGFLLGAAFAGVRPLATSRAGRALAVAGPLCAAGLAVAVMTFRSSPTMFGGAVQATDAACIVAALWAAGMRRGPLVSAPLVAIGRFSYGLYLWHWPFMLIADSHISSAWMRAVSVFAVSSAAAAVSYRFVEQPLRHGSWLRRTGTLGLPRIAIIGPALALLIALAVIAATPKTDGTIMVTFDDATVRSAAEVWPLSTAVTTVELASVPTDSQPQERLTECRTVIHLGDSNLGVVRSLFEEAYRAAGVQVFIDHANGRGAFRSHDIHDSSALDAITAYRALSSSQRCWVIHLGLQDAADSASDNIDPSISIDAIIEALAGEPAIWVAPALHGDPPFTHEAATDYTTALRAATAHLENIHMIDWPSIADPRANEFQPDGIHYLTELYTTLVQVVMGEVLSVWTLLPADAGAAG